MIRKAKIISIILSVCMIVSLSGICASAEGTSSQVSALILSSRLDSAKYIKSNVNAMNDAFDLDGIERTVFENKEMTKSALQNAISSFAKQSVGSTKFVYITASSKMDDSTGEAKIDLYNGGMYFSELRTMLDEISGEIVLMIDSDYSGDAISSNSTETVSTLDSTTKMSPEQQIIDVFAKNDDETGNSSTYSDGNNFDKKNKYIVFCSCPSNTTTEKDSIGRATDAWGTGISVVNGKYMADLTGDGVVTAKELNDYAVNWIKNEVGETANLPCYYADPYFQSLFETDYCIGDVNMDGSINMKDDLLIRKYIAGQISLSSRQIQLADMNQDGKINMKDDLVIRKYIAGYPITEI